MTDPADLDAARDLVALTGAGAFAPASDGEGSGADARARLPDDERLDAAALAAVAHCRRILGAIVRLAATGLEGAAGPLARALFEAAVPVVWALGDPAARSARYLHEAGRALARLQQAAAREGVALPEALARAAGYRRATLAETLPSLDRMARGVGLAAEDVAVRRVEEALAHGAYAAQADDGDPFETPVLRAAARVFARLALATVRRVGGDATAIEAITERAAALGVTAGR